MILFRKIHKMTHNQFHAVVSRPRLTPGTSDATGVPPSAKTCWHVDRTTRASCSRGGRRCLRHLLDESWFEAINGHGVGTTIVREGKIFVVPLDHKEGTIVRPVQRTPGCIMAHKYMCSIVQGVGDV